MCKIYISYSLLKNPLIIIIKNNLSLFFHILFIYFFSFMPHLLSSQISYHVLFKINLQACFFFPSPSTMGPYNMCVCEC